jgi:hypothetical protein
MKEFKVIDWNKKNCPFFRGSFLEWKGKGGLLYNYISLNLESFFFQLGSKRLLVESLASGLVQ